MSIRSPPAIVFVSVVEEHKAVIAALADQDSTKAEDKMRAHIDAAFLKTFQNIELLRDAIERES